MPRTTSLFAQGGRMGVDTMAAVGCGDGERDDLAGLGIEPGLAAVGLGMHEVFQALTKLTRGCVGLASERALQIAGTKSMFWWGLMSAKISATAPGLRARRPVERLRCVLQSWQAVFSSWGFAEACASGVSSCSRLVRDERCP